MFVLLFIEILNLLDNLEFIRTLSDGIVAKYLLNQLISQGFLKILLLFPQLCQLIFPGNEILAVGFFFSEDGLLLVNNISECGETNFEDFLVDFSDHIFVCLNNNFKQLQKLSVSLGRR